MGKHEFGTAKYLSKQMKARGLQKLRFYCQVCLKQCRDENGFKSHIKSRYHLKNISKVTKKSIDEYTKQFESDFLTLLRMTHGEKDVDANKFYNEYIQDKDHIHMNATHFTSLTKFIQYLSKEGKIRVNSTERINTEMDSNHLIISYINNSYENILRNEKLNELSQNEQLEQHTRIMMLNKQMKMDHELSKDINLVLSDAHTSNNTFLDNKISLKLVRNNKILKKKPKRNVFKIK